MAECVILVRMNNGEVLGIMDASGSALAVCRNLHEAVSLADKLPLCQAMPYQVIELDDL